MVATKRVLAPRIDVSPTSRSHDNRQPGDPFVPFLSHLTNDCRIADLDPSSCVPLHLVRRKSNNAIQKLRTIINGDSISPSTILPGTSGTPTSIAVPLTGELMYLMDEWIESNATAPDEVAYMKAQNTAWYGIVDGCQLHAAIMQLRTINPSKWGKFMWGVFVVQPTY